MNILIIGAKAAGLKAACRAKRLLPTANVTVLDESEHISLAACGLPYFVSGDIEDFGALISTPYNVQRTPEFFENSKGVNVLTGMRAESIDSKKKVVSCRSIDENEKQNFSYDKLIIATGGTPAIPDIEGIDLPGVLTFHNAQEAIELRKAASQGQLEKVAIIGGGFIGCELVEALTALWGIQANLFELDSHMIPQMLDGDMSHTIELEFQRQGVKAFTYTQVTEISREGEKLKVLLDSGFGFDGYDRVIVATGVKPCTDLAVKAGIAIGDAGGIIVDSQLQTSVPDIYAAGDCVEVKHLLTGNSYCLPLGSLANKMGRVVANALTGKDDTFEPVVGAICLKIFDLNVAVVGLTADTASKAGFDVGEAWGVFTDKAEYYPEFENISTKLVFDKQSHRILGVQAISRGDAIRRIDAASTMIRMGLTLKQVRSFEPAYAPPYATALDPLHYLSYIGLSSVEDGIESCTPLDFEEIAGEYIVIDVREQEEVMENPIAVPYLGLLSIPFTQIREKLTTIPKDEALLIVCSKGVRSAEAARFLKQNGFKDVRYVGGGLNFYL